jgi:ribonuclease VapC
MVLDTSALLAVFFEEKYGDWVIQEMNAHAHALRMSTVNLTETLIRLLDKQPQLFKELEAQLLSHGIRFVAPSVEQAHLAAEARVRFPLNLGDCFAYALAVTEDVPILTLDRDFRVLDHPVVLPI